VVAINRFGESTPSDPILITIELTEPDDGPSGSNLFYIIGGGLGIFALGVVGFIIIKKRKK
jgi:LPXTG-motif cell wall-anchored protein